MAEENDPQPTTRLKAIEDRLKDLENLLKKFESDLSSVKSKIKTELRFDL